MRRIVMFVVMWSSLAAADPRGGITGAVYDPIGDPVEGATVFIASSSGLELKLVTDRDGRYATTVAGTGTYRLVFVHGTSRSSGSVVVSAGVMSRLDGEVDPNTGEVIHIHDRLPPPVPPKAPHA